QARLGTVRAADHIDYPAVAACKDEILRLVYRAFRLNVLCHEEHPRAKSFRAFQAQQGECLRRFAVFAAAGSPVDDPDEYAAQHLEDVEFHEYLQWQADLQLAAAQDVAQ